MNADTCYKAKLKHIYGINSTPDTDVFNRTCQLIESDPRINIIEKEEIQITFFGTCVQKYKTKNGPIIVVDDYDEWLDVHIESDMDLAFLGYKE